MLTNFSNIGCGGGLIDYMQESNLRRFGGKQNLLRSSTELQCLPLYSILRAIGVKHVDYFSLDIEGAELDAIKTLALDEITVDIFTIEYVVGNIIKSRTDSVKTFRAIKDHFVGKYDNQVFHVSEFDDVFLKKKPSRVN